MRWNRRLLTHLAVPEQARTRRPSYRRWNGASLPATLVGLGIAGCAPTWTPEQIDAVATQCRAGIDNGEIAPRPSSRVSIPQELKPAGEPVIVYGASWCEACTMAEAYLARRHIAYEVRDVESNEGAAARDRALARAGLAPTTAVPVIDARGVVTVGFFPCLVEKYAVADHAS
jgi:glutaredoxin